MIEKLMIDSFEKSQILEQNETPYLECCHMETNGEYSGQNCLFMPHPQYPENVIFALFFAAFFPIFGAGGTI